MARRDAPLAADARDGVRLSDEHPLSISMKPGLPSVSAIVATRDRPELLRRAVASILEQDYEGAVECVVVADGDEPIEPARLGGGDAPTRRLLVTRNDRTPGLAGARNAGAGLATAELLAFCDDDDEWLAGKLRAQVDVLIRSGADTVVTGIEILAEGRATVRIPRGPVGRAALVRSRSADVHPSTVLVRRSAFDGSVGPMDEAIPGSYGEDYEWLLRAAAHAPIEVVPHALVRIHRGASHFSGRWEIVADGIGYLLAKHPELAADRRNAARLYGRLAFANAALGRRREAFSWAWRSIRRRPAEPRPYLATAVACGVVSPATVERQIARSGRGV
jgi:glycosyltransferase involved in cell wall biosynthesis